MVSDYEREIHGGAGSECGECGCEACDGHPELMLAHGDAVLSGDEEPPPWLNREEAAWQAYDEAAEIYAARFGLEPRGASRVGSYGDNGGIITFDH